MGDILFRVLDFETSDLELPAEIVEIGWTDVIFNTENRAASIGTTHANLYWAANGISPTARAAHHISPLSLIDKPPCTPADIRVALCQGEPYAIVAHNAEFERQWATDDLALPGVYWIDTMKAALHIWPEAPGHSNQVLRYWLVDQEAVPDLPAERAEPAHRAGPDTFVTAVLLCEMLRTHRVAELVRFTLEPRFYPTCPLRKHRGPWSAVPHSFLTWMVDKAEDMERDLKMAAQAELDRRRRG